MIVLGCIARVMRIASEGSGANQEVEQSLSPGDQPDRIALYVFPRQRATIYGLGVGILVGIGNSFFALDFSFRWELAGTLAAAIVTVLLPLAVETGENHSFLPQTCDRRSGKIRRGRFISYRPRRGQCATSVPTSLRVANVMQRKALATVTPRRPSAE